MATVGAILNWIPVQQLIIFKILLITYKALNDLAAIYISNSYLYQCIRAI